MSGDGVAVKLALLLCALLGSACGAATGPRDGGSSCPLDRSDPLVCYSAGDGGDCTLVDIACCGGAWTCPSSTEMRHRSELPDGGGCINLNYGAACP